MKNGILKVSVLGCGWLGMPLASSLVQKGYFVKGSTTQTAKLGLIAQNQIDPFLIQFEQEIVGDDIQHFLDVDLLIINIPPGRNSENAISYEHKMELLANAILQSPVKKIIYVSSTSVYPEINSEVDESLTSLDNSPSAERMKFAEEIFSSLVNRDTSVIRMAGLIGPNRHPGRFFAGKENIPNGLAPVNLIHLDDCIGIIEQVIEKELWNQTFNGAAPTHPTKMDFYDLASQKLYNQHARFKAEKGNFKVVNSDKIIQSGYQFKHPDLMEWLLQTPQN